MSVGVTNPKFKLLVIQILPSLIFAALAFFFINLCGVFIEQRKFAKTIVAASPYIPGFQTWQTDLPLEHVYAPSYIGQYFIGAMYTVPLPIIHILIPYAPKAVFSTVLDAAAFNNRLTNRGYHVVVIGTNVYVVEAFQPESMQANMALLVITALLFCILLILAVIWPFIIVRAPRLRGIRSHTTQKYVLNQMYNSRGR